MTNPPAIDVGVDAQNPLEVTAARLHEALTRQTSISPPLQIIDLRTPEEYAQFHIPSSVNTSYSPQLPLDTLVAHIHEAVTKNTGAVEAEGSLPLVLFVSLQSPDLDDLVAREVIGEYERTHGVRPPAWAVGILVGGVAGYREQYPDHV